MQAVEERENVINRQIEENKESSDLKNIFKSNIIFIIGIILLTCKGLYLSYILEIGIEGRTVYYAVLASALIMSPIINNRKKFGYIYLNVIYLILTIIIYANYLYYNYSTNFLSLYQIENIKYAKEIGSGLSSLIDIKNILMFWTDSIIVLLLSIISYKKLEKIKSNNILLKIGIIFIIVLSNFLIVKEEINELYAGLGYNRSMMVQKISIYYYHYEDAKEYFLNMFIKPEIDLEKLENAYNENINSKVLETEYTGIAKDKNVIILQLESLNEYVIGKKINGKEITPNLNKFFAENTYCSNMYNQGLGTTADSEFEMENSMYPLENGYVFQKYYGNSWRDIYSTLKQEGYYTSFMHPNTSAFWNREAVYNTGYNIDEYNDIESFKDIERAGQFYSDEGFFKKAVEIMNSYEGKFCTTLVSITTHTPFTLDGVTDFRKKITITYEDVSKYSDWSIRNYLISCNFVDYAFGEFLKDLEETGLADESILIVYGDHGAGIAETWNIEELYKENNEEYTKLEDHMLDVHVPFGIRIPTVNNSQKIENAVSKIDIKPTILDLLGVEDKFSIGTSIFSGKDYSFIKGIGYVTSRYCCINDKYYNKKTSQEITETEELRSLLQKMENEIYLSDTIIKNDMLRKR